MMIGMIEFVADTIVEYMMQRESNKQKKKSLPVKEVTTQSNKQQG